MVKKRCNPIPNVSVTGFILINLTLGVTGGRKPHTCTDTNSRVHASAHTQKRTDSFVSKDLAVKPMINNQYLQAILTADRNYCLRWRCDLTNTGGEKKTIIL